MTAPRGRTGLEPHLRTAGEDFRPDQGRHRPVPGRVRELWLTGASLVATCSLAAGVGVLLAVALTREIFTGQVGRALLIAVAGLAIAGLVYGGLVYQFARWGHYRRLISPDEPHPGRLDDLFAPDADPGLLTVLVPSYREELEVVRQTVLSAALQEYPDRRVVVLVDDPPTPDQPKHAAALAAVRGLPAQVHDLFADQARRLAGEEGGFVVRTGGRTALSPEELCEEAGRVANLYERCARWLDDQAAREAAQDHTARLFSRLTFSARAAACRECAGEVASACRARTLTLAGLERHYHRLARMFAVEVTVFERKRYANLSHAANKAMNLNAYISLLARRWREVPRPDGLHLEPHLVPLVPRRPDESATHSMVDVPASRWLLTVDADSLLVHDYAARLVASMSAPEHARTAVMQTPYSAVPGATGPVERTAGATTDIMHVVHQGSTHFGATYWVGANALLRTAALADIATTVREGGKDVTRFIQDRTVIEDTESTVDLVDAGWRLHNYPARLAYSATPADYGSLLIQRQRWANGGLLILPKLLSSYWRSGLRGRVSEAAMRVHYLVSIAVSNIALLVLMLVPPPEDVPVVLLAATSLPYFALYARDLRLIGRRRRDLLEVYALNLLLLPVNLGGVLMSLRQSLTGRRIPFVRTPKVSDRIAAPAGYIALTLALVVLWCTGAVVDAAAGRDLHAAMGALNTAVLTVAIARYIGWRDALVDLSAPVRSRLDRGARRLPGRTSIESVPSAASGAPSALAPHPASDAA